jgi:hypothetical protein
MLRGFEFGGLRSGDALVRRGYQVLHVAVPAQLAKAALAHLLHHAGQSSSRSTTCDRGFGVVSRRRGRRVDAGVRGVYIDCSLGGSATPQAPNTALGPPLVSVRSR